MPFSSVGDVARAYDEGRVWNQRFYKAGGTGHQNVWKWWGDTNGQPGYDALVGNELAFTPRIMSNNSGGIYAGVTTPLGSTKHIVYASVAVDTGNASNQWEDFIFFDLLGVYPLIDGTISDLQVMDNTQALPRYADGNGVRAVIINHIAPMTQAGTGTMNYIDDTGASKSVAIRITSQALNQITTSINPTSGNEGAIYVPLASGSNGLRSVTSISFSSAQPGGSLCIALIRPLFNMVCGGPAPAGGSRLAAVEKCFTCRNGALYPRVFDGAAINIMYRHSGGNNATTLWGDLTFAWGNT